MNANTMESIIEKSVDFTRIHMLDHFADKEKHPISIIFRGASKPHIDLINYTMIFFNAVFLNEFYNKFHRFPGLNELKETKEKGNKLLEELEQGILKYDMTGEANIIDLRK